MTQEAQLKACPLDIILAEVERAIAKFPTWPTDPLHALAVLGEEYGELNKAVLQSVYEPHKSGPSDVREEAIQTSAMTIRFVASLDAYEYAQGVQHDQPLSAIQTRAPDSVIAELLKAGKRIQAHNLCGDFTVHTGGCAIAFGAFQEALAKLENTHD